MVSSNRVNTYHTVAAQLGLLSDQALSEILEKATLSGNVNAVGRSTGSLEISGTRVFFKKINLTDIERQPENIMSTKNLFELPLYYQHGIGSDGFSAWRELFVNIMATNWVLTGACQNFPLMYHWRVLPRQVQPLSAEELKNLNDSVEYWGGSPAIRARLEAIQKSSANIVLFLEHIPEALGMLLQKQFDASDNDNCAAEATVAMVERDLSAVTSFMQSHGLLHFDAHLGNILTDGHRLYFADFGLAICSRFELSEAESTFFKIHRNYDRYEMATCFATDIISILFEKEKREAVLNEYAAGTGNKIKAPGVAEVVARYAPIAVVMRDFWKQLRKDKTTLFPASELERLSVAAGFSD